MGQVIQPRGSILPTRMALNQLLGTMQKKRSCFSGLTRPNCLPCRGYGVMLICVALAASLYIITRNHDQSPSACKQRASSESAHDGNDYKHPNIPPSTTGSDGGRYSLQAARMEKRRARVENVCATMKTSFPGRNDSRFNFVVDPDRSFTLCYVAKTGSTSWRRIFLTLQNIKSHTKSDDLFYLDANPRVVHRGTYNRVSQMDFDEALKFLTSATKIVFARDPFSRLFSGFVDKFVFTEFWGVGFAQRAVRRYRKDATEKSAICAHDLTFEEYLRMAIDEFPADDDRIRGHWSPVSTVCHPCHYHFDIIGKQETFTADRDFILEKLGLQNIIPFNDTLDKKAMDSMRNTCYYTWGKMKRLPKVCRNSSYVLQNLLRGFTYQGFLPPNVKMPWTNFDDVTMSMFLRFLENVYRKQNLTKGEHMNRRHKILEAAYNSIPLHILRKVQCVYNMDFRMFDYDAEPSYIFGDR